MSHTIVIGSGVNELVAAHYLARAGHDVVVLEQHAPDELEALEPGWIPPRIVRDLALDRDVGTRTALTVREPDPWVAAPTSDGARLELWNDPARSTEALRRYSPRDAARWPDFCGRMARLAGLLKALYIAPPPDLMAREPRELLQLVRTALRVRGLGRRGIEDLMRVLPMPIADLLDDWFECDALKGVLGAAGILDLNQGPRSAGTAFRLLHHHVGSAPGVFRPPRSNLRRVLETRAGIQLRRAARVARISVREERASGVVLQNGDEVPARLVVCGADPRLMFLEWVDTSALAPEFTRAVRHVRRRGVAARVVLDLQQHPGFDTLAIAPSLDYLERAYDDAKYGRISREPYLEARAVQADGAHRLEVDVQYAPYAPREGDWNEAQRSALAERVVEMLTAAAPGLASLVTERSVLAPSDLEARHGFPEGQRHHAELALDQSFWMRPLPGWASYRTPIRGLYLCGPGTHPGGAIAGAAGFNAARVVLRDLRNG